MNLAEITAPTLTNLTAIAAEMTALQERAKAARKEALEPFLAALAASGLVSVIVVRGYTPSFNDGEPCEHSADFYVNVDQLFQDDLLESDDYGLGSLVEDEHDEADGEWFKRSYRYEHVNGAYTRVDIPDALEHNTALAAKHGHVWAAPDAEVLKAIGELIFNTEEEDNGTNYYATYILEDGKFVRREGGYDCGN